jgi:50S ribosomal subunit-associated GTPase HflX
MKTTKMRTFFTAGKLHEIAQHIKDYKVDCIFVNAELSALQNKNLEKFT